MLTHWSQNWLAIVRQDQLIVLYGEGATEVTHALIELHLVQDAVTEAPTHSPGIQRLLDKFSSFFDTPSGLPPRRQYDHQIPLVLGARPVSVRPYRVAPELKAELEW
jgi:hypothetical protein